MAKLYTAKRAIAVASETVEAFGGAGYVEDSGIPRLLRDAQVLSIWEGTTNVLSLDTLRAMERNDAFAVWLGDVRQRLGSIESADLRSPTECVSAALKLLEAYAARAARAGKEFQQSGARAFSYSVARVEAATLLIEHANAANDEAASVAAKRWSARELTTFVEGDSEHRRGSAFLTGFDRQA